MSILSLSTWSLFVKRVVMQSVVVFVVATIAIARFGRYELTLILVAMYATLVCRSRRSTRCRTRFRFRIHF